MYKPGASIRTHLFVAALLWSVIGMSLMTCGLLALKSSAAWGVAVLAFVLGTVKSRFMLDSVARKNISRIQQLREGTCIGAVYSIQTWGLVLLMVFMGRLLRTSSLPRELFGLLYTAVGWALLGSSRVVWRIWRT